MLAGEWTRMGLLGPALWVKPENVRRARSGPPRIDAIVLVVDRTNELVQVTVDLFEALARESARLVRLVKLRSASPSRELDAEQDDVAEHVAEYLTKSMPLAVPSASIADQSTDLMRVTLICAPTEFQLQQRVDWAASEYGTVVIASPEDRSSPWSGDAFVRDNERFVGFALMHLASVAGLWNGVGKGTFELFPREASGMQSVWVSRVFLHAIITESLGRRTAAQVLDDIADPESLLIDPSSGTPPEGTAFIGDRDVERYVDQMVEAAMSLDDGALSAHPAAMRRRPGVAGSAPGRRCAHSARSPSTSWSPCPAGRGVGSPRRTGRALTRQLQSDEGTHVVGHDYDEILDAADAQLVARRDEIFEAERRARAGALGASGSGLSAAPRRGFGPDCANSSSVRSTAAPTFPTSALEPIEGKVPVFGHVTDVFPARG